jgi:hypothetical protein
VREAALRRAPRAIAAYRRHGSFDWIPEWLAPEVRQDLYEQAEAKKLEGPGPQGPGAEQHLRERRRKLDHPLEALAMEHAFEAGRRVGLRMLHPLWDVDVVELLCRTPPALLNRGGREKGLVRDLLASRFPELGRDWLKPVFGEDYEASILLSEARHALERFGGTPALEEAGLVEPARLRTFLDQRVANGNQSTHGLGKIWDILST